MAFFNFNKHEELPAISDEEQREAVISYLRELDDKEYKKVIKVAEIYRKADADANQVTYGCKSGKKDSAELPSVWRRQEELAGF